MFAQSMFSMFLETTVCVVVLRLHSGSVPDQPEGVHSLISFPTKKY